MHSLTFMNQNSLETNFESEWMVQSMVDFCYYFNVLFTSASELEFNVVNLYCINEKSQTIITYTYIYGFVILFVFVICWKFQAKMIFVDIFEWVS